MTKYKHVQVKDPGSKEPIIFDIDASTLSEPEKDFMIRDINRSFVEKLKMSLAVSVQTDDVKLAT